MDYRLEIAGLADKVAAATPSPKHAGLLACLHRASPKLANAKVSASRGDRWLEARKVLTASGELVHHNHREYLQHELDVAGSVSEAVRRLSTLDLRLSQCNLVSLYVCSDNGGAQDNVV